MFMTNFNFKFGANLRITMRLSRQGITMGKCKTKAIQVEFGIFRGIFRNCYASL